MEKWVRVRVLGEGSYGVVWLEKKGKEIRAVKQVSKANFILNQRELYALEELKEYPKHFVKLLEWFEDQKNIYIAMEYIEHGDLMGVVKSRQGSISEDEIRSVARQLLIALRIMHSKSFCHRDLKPQNILVTSISPIKVKIADFGVTKQSSDSTQLRTVVGTWGYMAPEVLGFSNAETSWYTSSADIWSLGSLLHFIFTNEVPFPDNRKLINYVRENNSPFPTEKLQERGASSDAKDFIKSLMSPCPEKRLTANQALVASWLRSDEPGQISPLPQIILPNAPEPTRVSIQNG
ncbi:kinase-like domain-containing protein [Morchella snyderi]|nr:kinase-like domain-containing protein [Morchella snyderi]